MDEVINAFIWLLHDTESFIRKSPGYYPSDALADFLKEFRLKRINPLHERLKSLDCKRYVLSMVGLTNVGKSTLAHALLGYPIAPRRNSPATSIPVEYEYRNSLGWSMITHYNVHRAVQNFDSAEELATALKRVVFDYTPTIQAEHIERVLVHGPMDLLEGGLVFADTPGFGAAQSVDSEGNHYASLVAYIDKYVHEVLFCVSGAIGITIGHEEVAFFNTIREKCSTVVVTKWDNDPDKRECEIKKYKSMYAHLFPLSRFMFVEAKWAIEGHVQGDADKLASSQVEELRTLIRQRTSDIERRAAFRQPILDAWDDLLELVSERLREAGLSFVPWREDALLRFKEIAGKHSFPFRNLS